MGKWHPLHTAAIGGNLASVQREFARLGKKSGKKGNALNDVQDSNGYTALHFAVQCGNVEIIKWMIEKGADVDIQCKVVADSVTPLIIAANRSWIDAAKLLLEAGANPRIGRAQDGFTPLHLAAKANDLQLARLILKYVPSTVAALSKTGLSCIDVAKAAGATQIVTALFSMFPDLQGDLNSKSRGKGRRASPRGGGSVAGFDSRLCKSLIELTRQGAPVRLKEFIRANPSVDLNWTMGKNGWTALMEVSATGDMESAQILLEAGADSEIRSKKGYTALLIAARHGRIDLLKVLLDKGACLDVVTPTGETVEEVASIYGQSAVFAFFVAYRAELIVLRQRQADQQKEQQKMQENLANVAASIDTSVPVTSLTPPTVKSNDVFFQTPGGEIVGENDFNLLSWLTGIGLGKYFDVLCSNGFDCIASLNMVTTDDFTEMGILLGHKRLFLAEFAKLKESHPCLFEPKSFSFTPSSRSVSSDDLARFSSFRSTASTPDLVPGGEVYAVADVLKQDADVSQNSSMSDISSLSTMDTFGGQENYRDITVPSQMTMIKEIKYEELTIGRVIGEGSFGIVHFAVWRGMNVAVKALKITEGFSSFASGSEQSPKLSSADDEFLRHEAKLMARVCNHDHVIQFVGIVVNPCPCVVTIFCPQGSVEDLLVTSERKHEVEYATVLRMALEAAKGIRHLHLEGVIHRDLAARNLLLDSNLHVRVGDFGFSRVKAAAASKGYTKSDMGPIRWLAPEAMRRKMYSEASDVFSFGVVLFEMFWKSMPWPDFDTLDVAIRVCNGERMEIKNVDFLPQELLNLMQSCWEEKATSRPPLSSVISCLNSLLLEAQQLQVLAGKDDHSLNYSESEYCEMQEVEALLAPPTSVVCNVDVSVSQNDHDLVESMSLLSAGTTLGGPPESMYSMKLGNDAFVKRV